MKTTSIWTANLDQSNLKLNVVKRDWQVNGLNKTTAINHIHVKLNKNSLMLSRNGKLETIKSNKLEHVHF